jgi:cytochrome P450
MSLALYELALHPNIQHRLRTEITQVLSKHQGEVTYDAMQEMTYLDMVVSAEETKASHALFQGCHKSTKYCLTHIRTCFYQCEDGEVILYLLRNF